MIKELIRAGFTLSGTSDSRLIRGLVGSAVEGGLTAAPYPFLFWLLRDLFAGEATINTVVVCALGMAVSVLLRIIAGRYAMPRVFAGAYAMMSEARLRIADHLRQLPMGWFAKQRSGDLSSRLTSDLELIEHIWSHFLGIFVSGLMMPLCLVLFLFFVDWRLACIVAASMPVALCMLNLTQKMLSRPGERMIKANMEAQSALLEYVQGITVIRSFGRYGAVWSQLEKILKEQQAAMLGAEAKPAPWLAAYGFILETGYVCLILAGAWWLSNGTLAPSTLIIALILSLAIYRQLFDVGLSTMLLRFARRALQRIEALLNEPALPEPVTPEKPGDASITFDHVSFAYDEKTVLHDISCHIPEHSMTAIVGSSGAGKSTFVHLIARLWDVNRGSIRVGNVDLRHIGTEALHRYIGMVFQDVWLFSGSILDNIRMGKPDATRDEVIVAAQRAQAHQFISLLPEGYDTVLDEGGSSLSGGERQRISIARALLKDAPILLLDEATASVDPSAEADIQRAISELAKGRTVIVIAHKLKNIRHADKILVLSHGTLTEMGTHETLVQSNGLYAQLWHRQQEALVWQIGSPLKVSPSV